MTISVLTVVLVIAGIVAFRVWRKWIEPWRELEELVKALTAGETARKFLISANPRAAALGSALEQFATKHQLLTRQASESGSSLEAILAALPDGLAVVDEQRRLQLTNIEFRRVFHLQDDPRGVPLLEATRDAAAERAVTRALAEGEAQCETMKLAGDGDATTHIEVCAVPFTATGSRGAGAVVLFRNVTQAHRVEEMRRDFVANVSHELRTPLSIFRGYLETLLENPKQPPGELLRILEVMERHSDRLNALVEDVLTLARLESPEAELDLSEIDVEEFLRGIVRDWQRRLEEKQLTAEVQVQPNLPPLSADEGRLQEIIYNLLDNALKYSRPGGRVRLEAQRVDDRIRISVSDEGVGIREADLPRIFERFYRADKARSRQLGGTGLGLSIVKHIAQLHGGTVAAESTAGRGTTIIVELPIGGPPAAA